ncbi:MAG TPA: ChaN family lipoprotein [Phycisphaerales bacterium]|nr:ChaN family lipoprotein [Phycisphaerales bacterium]
MRLLTSLLLVVSTLLAACASSKPARRPLSQPAHPITDPRSLPIFNASTGDPASWSDLVTACRDADFILLGENHGHPIGLPFAAALWTDTLADSPKAALAFEFFERDEQPRVDEYLLGLVDEPTFRKRTQRTASNYPPEHRAMLEATKDAGRPVIAANAPRPLVRLARLQGLDRLRSLPPSLAPLVRIPDSLPDGRYRDDFIKLMTGQPLGPDAATDPATDPATEPTPPDAEALARAESMFLSQSVWDWTMADSVARALDEGHRPVALVVGRFHVDHHGGLVQALAHLKPDAKIVIITTIDDHADQLLQSDRHRATFVVYVGSAMSPK